MTGSQVAVFWGQSTEELSDVCGSGDYDVVIMAFLTSLIPPKLNLGKDTGSASTAQSQQDGWGLFDATVPGASGTSVASQISDCQSKGIKVLISFGGTTGISDATLSSSDDAKTAADNLWNLFLGGTSMQDLRPFGTDVVLDGVDLDNETGDGSNYDTFLSTLTGYFGSDTSKSYYISADPMCSQVDAGDSTSIPKSVMKYINFMNVQFYNDDSNELGASNFESNIQAWDALFSSVSPSPKLVVAIPGGKGAADTTNSNPVDIQDADQIKSSISTIKGMGLKNLGGVAIWDAGYAANNTGFSAAVKGAL
ncbi:family 18 glycoside hydrolase [Cryphonectria parasitica EP155]|uniref:chitinase n=1 Tax=Cryphonectria parasitica (strain ATCC 38755 / EP155) TaxID=660469 RepID=A0A9P5CN17_CRYP1|nr:family 18 glycoside hydrolase [Cryphonectria parasitica EP155]KAF3763445.1 family 18 glycoside hydrolase [Cryphonectria parasitica EP155]